MSEINEGDVPQDESLRISRDFIEAGWKGSAEEPVINWPTENFEDRTQYTVVLSSDGSYYYHEGFVDLPTDVKNVRRRTVYELHNKKWRVIVERD